MIQDSVALMTVFDVAIVGAAVYACHVLFTATRRAWHDRIRLGVMLVLASIGFIALFYLADLVAMHLLPFAIGRPAAMSFMDALHAHVSWYVTLAAVFGTAAGLVLIVRGVGTTLAEMDEATLRFRTFIEQLPSAISFKRADGRYIMGNSRFNEWFNPDGENIVGRRTRDFVDSAHAEDVDAMEAEVLETRGTVVRELEVPTVHAGDLPVLLQKFPVVGRNGEILGIGTIESDISRIKQTEERLERSLKLLNDAMEVARLGFWEWDEVDDRVISYSNGALQLLGMDGRDDQQVEMPGPRYVARIHPDDRENYLATTTFATNRADRFEIEYRLFASDGSIRHIREVGRAVRDADGRALKSFGTIQDVTERATWEQSLQEAREEAEQANRAKTEFLAHMSHELRTPLNSILGFAQMIAGEFRDREGNPRHVEYARDIERSGQHLLQVINDILDLSRIEAGKIALDIAPFDVAACVRASVRLVAGAASGPASRFAIEVTDPPPVLEADERYIRQILINILSNAAKFTPQDGRIETRAETATDGGVVIHISDTGCGISADDLPRVLIPFGQARRNAALSHQGVGLGLSLSKRLAELHGGTLEIESELGRGTVVTLRFPKRAAAAVQGGAGTARNVS